MTDRIAKEDYVDAHVTDVAAAHAATAISFAPDGSIVATTVQAAIVEVRDEAAGGGAPSTADYLVGTANGGLSAEIVVGTSPGGELGGTWASPTVDATHSGSTHAAIQAAAEATAAAALSAHEADTTSIHGITNTATLATTATKLDDFTTPDDNTDLNASTSAHGLLKKLPNDASHLLDGLGDWKQIGWNIVTKPSDETVTSSTTLQNDDHLTFATVVGGIYEFQVACIYTSASATPDIKFAMGDSGTTQGVALGGPSFTTADGAQAPGFLVRSGTGAFAAGTGAGDTRIVQMDGMWRGIGTTWVFQWAQNTSDAAGVTVKAGSVVRYRRLL